MPTFLQSLEQIRNVEWSRTYLWDIQFPEAPTPFNDWFPAVDVEYDIYSHTPYTVNAGQSTFKIPKASEALGVRVTFNDNVDNVLADWMEEWVQFTILGGRLWAASLDEAVKEVRIARLGMDRIPTTGGLRSYWVMPEDTLIWRGTSDAGVNQYQISLHIAGDALRSPALNPPT